MHDTASSTDVFSQSSCKPPSWHVFKNSFAAEHGQISHSLPFTNNRFHFRVVMEWAVIAQSVQRLDTGCTVRGSNPCGGGGAKFSSPVQSSSEAHPASRMISTGSLSPRVERPSRGVGHPPPSMTEVKEIVQLYLYYGRHAVAQLVDTALQVGRSRVRFPMVSLQFLIGIILLAALWLLGSTQPLTEMSTRNISWGVKAAGA